MTREERINSALLPILEKMRGHGATDEMCKMYDNGFHVGAMWADQTMIEKACEWLYEYNRKQADKMFGTVHTADVTINVAEFRKAMKGE